MIVFHGTDQNSANAILTTGIDVTLGGGELGQGFYVGENVALVAARAKGKTPNNFAVIEFDVNNSDFITLNMKIIRRQDFLVKQWASLIRRNLTHTRTYGYDVICAPYATFEFSNQYKFETQAGENVINNANKKTL